MRLVPNTIAKRKEETSDQGVMVRTMRAMPAVGKVFLAQMTVAQRQVCNARMMSATLRR